MGHCQVADEQAMASHVSLVDDPEKHFLGNLLDEDPNISPPLLNRGSCSSPGAIPPVSVISSVGPVSTNNLLRSYWPEPPPPYSPPIQQQTSWYNNDLPPPCIIPVSSEYFANVGTGQPTFITQPQIHHHHHNLHHHTHTHNVVENHHHYPITTVKVPSHGYFVDRLPETSPNQRSVLKTNENLTYKNTKTLESQKESTKEHHPWSLDTSLSKPPLSYRDVAARNDQNTCNDSSLVQQNKKRGQLDLESRCATARTRDVVVRGSSSSARMNRDRKPKSEQGVDFQKITRKKIVARKEKLSNRTVLCDSASLPLIGLDIAVDAPTKYEVLQVLTSKTKTSHSDDVLVAKHHDRESMESSLICKQRSRSSSLSPGVGPVTVIDVVARPKRAVEIIEKKKRTSGSPNSVEQSQQRRRVIREQIEYGWIEKAAVAISVASGWIEFVFRWILNILMNLCLQIYDAVSISVTYLCGSTQSFVRRVLLMMNTTAILLISSARHVNIRRLLRLGEPEALMWGLDENIVLPTTGEQVLERFLSSSGCQDAYGVLGLKASCSEEDIRRHYKRLIGLLNPEKNVLEGAEEACVIVTKAYQALATPEARKMYNLNRVHPRKNDLHHEIGEMWNKVRLRIEDARSFMYCDCGRRHAKIALNIRQSEARYCRRCKTRHAAKANDIWVETRLCGLLWVYFTCCDGIIYDITDWATCEINYLKHVRPNSHNVQYRLVSPTNVQQSWKVCY
ncbi:hypothetical protein KIN20_031024 [Parelaphostrongylus tenuis]|uniref:J domain-containing protein n=1 Tax=Parelaphostrongylus tenuis TaxID=148309 RepID=A0AAD5R4V3_PARTN|nr:hypothetical protein KIN20_031024 [Parelaphostrongylus tenuis]